MDKIKEIGSDILAVSLISNRRADMPEEGIRGTDFHIYYSSADAYETGYGWVLIFDGRPAMLFSTKEAALVEASN